MRIRWCRVTVMAVALAASVSLGALQSGAQAYALDPSYAPTASFPVANILSTDMTLAFDGSSYWSCSGGNWSGLRFARHNAAGVEVATYAPGLDFRSVFTDAAGNVYARAYDDPTIYLMTSPGVFASHVTLVGGSLYDQAAVVFNGDKTEFIARYGATVDRWNLSGVFLGSVTLSGLPGGGYNIAVLGDYWYTYSAGILTEWSTSGTSLGTTTLVGGGNNAYTLSVANDMVFVTNSSEAMWNGFAIEPAAEDTSLTYTGVFADTDNDGVTTLTAALSCEGDPTLVSGQTADFCVDLNGDGDFLDDGEVVGSGITDDDGQASVAWAHAGSLAGLYRVRVEFAGTDDLVESSTNAWMTVGEPRGRVAGWALGAGRYQPDSETAATASFGLWVAQNTKTSSVLGARSKVEGTVWWAYEGSRFKSTQITSYVVGRTSAGRTITIKGTGLLEQVPAVDALATPAATRVSFVVTVRDGDPGSFGISFEGRNVSGESGPVELDPGSVVIN